MATRRALTVLAVLVAASTLGAMAADRMRDARLLAERRAMRVDDPYATIPYKLRPVLEGRYEAIERETGVDLRFLIDSAPEGESLEAFALHEMRLRGIGRETDRRAMLVVFDLRSGSVRIEVGPQLEGLFPDGLVGRLVRGHVAGRQAVNEMSQTIVSTDRLISYRLREAALKLAFDPLMRSEIADSTRLAAGGGATYTVASGGKLRMEVAADPRLDTLLGPGRTADEVLARYRTWMSLPVYVPRAQFFTESSRDFFERSFKMTPEYWEYLRYVYLNSAMAVETRGDVAVAYSTDNPLATPLFFRRTEAGWQYDVRAEMAHSLSVAGYRYAWGLAQIDDAWDAAFGDRMVMVDGARRFKDGANAPYVFPGTRVAGDPPPPT